MSNQANSLKKGLTVKDLVTTGIFSAIFFCLYVDWRSALCAKPGSDLLHAHGCGAAVRPHLSADGR